MTTKRRPRSWLAIIAMTATFALVAVACGSDSSSSGGDNGNGDDNGSGSEVQGAAGVAALGPIESVAGCEDGWTDPSDMEVGRPVARCAPGSPAPQPLPEMTTVKMSSAFRLEFNSPVLLAESKGEFAKENIQFEFVDLGFSDAVPQLAQGSLDAAIGGIELALYNAGNQDIPVKAVMGNYYPPDAGNYDVAQTGLWCRRDSFTNPSNPDPAETAKLKWASSVGKGSSAVYYSVAELRKRVPDFQTDDLQVDKIPSTDIVQALTNGAIDCGVLLDPLWLQVSDNPDYVQMATQTPGEPLGLVAFGKSFLQDRPEVGVAFTRAIIRTINTYFQGDYHADPEVLAEIAKVTNQPDTSRLEKTPSLVMDWELRGQTTDEMQKLFIDLGVITEFSEPVAEDKVVDRSFYERAVGYQG